MAKYSASELGRMIGQTRQYVTTYKNRGRLIVSEDGTFDLSNPINKAWYEPLRKNFIEKSSLPEYQAQQSDKIVQKPARQTTNKPQSKEFKEDLFQISLNIPDSEEEQGDDLDDNSSGGNQYARRQEAELKIKLLEIKKREIDLEQKEGKLLNMSVAKGIVDSYMSSYSKGLFRDLETWVFRIMDIHKIPLGEKVSYTNDLEKIMNAASDRTMKEVLIKLESEKTQL